MTDIEKYATDEDFFVNIRGSDGKPIEWMAMDFRDGEYSEYNTKKLKKEFAEFDPIQIKMMALAEREKKRKRWLIISLITGIIAVLSWWGLFH